MDVDFLTKEIVRQMTEYSSEVTEKVNGIVEETAQETVDQLKKTSPKRKGKKGGKYAKGWKVKKTANNDKAVRVTIHNSHYQLTHLLEKGHASRNGSRVAGIPHIAPAEEQAEKNSMKGWKKSCDLNCI